MTYDEMIELIQAAKDGKVIQTRHKKGVKWIDNVKPSFDAFFDLDYRVKPDNLIGYLNIYSPICGDITCDIHKSRFDADNNGLGHLHDVA